MKVASIIGETKSPLTEVHWFCAIEQYQKLAMSVRVNIQDVIVIQNLVKKLVNKIFTEVNLIDR